MVHLRLVPARNQQVACINLAGNFAFDGAIAQLGERVTGSHEVVGSSPTSSTPPSVEPITIGSNPGQYTSGTNVCSSIGGRT